MGTHECDDTCLSSMQLKRRSQRTQKETNKARIRSEHIVDGALTCVSKHRPTTRTDTARRYRLFYCGAIRKLCSGNSQSGRRDSYALLVNEHCVCVLRRPLCQWIFYVGPELCSFIKLSSLACTCLSSCHKQPLHTCCHT